MNASIYRKHELNYLD